MDFFLQLVITGLVVGSVYALVALGFVLIYKSSDVINFAQGEFLLVGAYIALTMVMLYNVPFLAAVALTLGFCVLLGLLVERLVLRPFIGEPVISVIMATIGLSLLMRGLVQMIWGTDTRTFPGIFSDTPIRMGELVVSSVYLWSLALAILLLVVFNLFFKYSSTGIVMRAAADDQMAALSMGISVKRIVAITWAIAAVVAAVGGILLGNINGINPTLAYIGLLVLPVVILGGLDSIPGAIVGGFTIGLLEALAGGYLDPIFGGGVKEVAPFVVLVIVLMIRPYGLFGKEIIERV
ncbi:MAG: branched-chain amino acid ABC transporter permease [Desulforudis sp.]|jgi:branched-chain amino acid transport system permease protein|nr:branched-chain amino acid ABC transporter permease [Clostridia bacterium]MDQ7790887.1 branched-chain amino acid ABC transporter permease [Clostridia bacterium]RJX17357.1 MAG: branched-chain amino acid ABC transporter permease [Desulforudis sp.]